MGNSESSKALPKINRARSQSPVGNSDNSVRGTRKREVCRVTGLTLHQKALLMRKWNRMEAYTVYLLGRRMFVNIFTENPNYLAYIELKGVANWKNHINFKIHVQRFVTALSEAMHRLREPSNSYDVLRDFGASYANYPKRVAPVYFERLANALSQTAAQLQESDHQITEKATSRDDISCSTDGDKLKLLAETVSENISDEAEMNVSLSSSLFSIPKHHSSRISLSQMNCMKDDLHSECRDHGSNGVCPITAEAWTVLSAFIGNQIKYGYETERVIRTEMTKLGLDGSGRIKRGHFSLQRPTQFA